MKKRFITKVLYCLLTVFLLPTACTDKFDHLENEEPDWLGPNIYDYLKNRGDCNYYVRLIEDCGYKESMQRTGSLTLFFSRDEAFDRFFKNNTTGISSYETMPQSMKDMLMRMGLLNDAQLVERMSYDEKNRLIIRRTTAFNPLDSIPRVSYAQMPHNKWFEQFQNQNILLMQDGTNWTLVQFFQQTMSGKNISDEDFKIISGQDREYGDAFVFSSKIIHKDIVCKNGYLHELEDLFFPPENMAGYIRTTPTVSHFNSLMDRFAVPVAFDIDPVSREIIYRMRYFNSAPVNAYEIGPDGVVSSGKLLFDPGWNTYQPQPSASTQAPGWQTDLGVMFVPTNEAMNDYFRPTGEGSDLYEAFGSWENVPDNIVADFIANHQKYSFFSAMPSYFQTMKDESGYEMGMTKENIVNTYIARNGVVYTINKVFPPLDYRSVMGPIKIDQGSQIFQKAISTDYCQFVYYLRSIYNWFNFFAVQDKDMKGYLDPVSLGYSTAEQCRLDFFITSTGNLAAKRISLQTGDSIGVITNLNQLKNRLTDILNQHTVIGNLNPDQEYYITKNGAPLHLKNVTVGSKVEGTGNTEQGNQATIRNVLEKANGVTYYIDRILEQSTHSTYSILRSKPEFSEFFSLCEYADFFTQRPTATTSALDMKVAFFDQYHYTIYVPTNAAMQTAHNAGLYPSVDDLERAYMAGDQEEYNVLVDKLVRFLRYHFQDNSIFIKGEKVSDKQYLSATLNTETNKFYPLYVTNSGGAISIRSNNGETAHVITDGNLYNLTARDIVVNSATPALVTSSTEIASSSWVVIHQIDKVLRIE